MDRYEEALERAKEIYNAPVATIVTRTFLEQIFPELKESEDECTRKELIHFILYKAGQLLDEETEHKFVAYLEKQKEPNYTKRNALFDKCVENCDPVVMKSVSDKVDEMLQKGQKPAARENDFVSNPKTSAEILKHYLTWATSEEENCPYSWKELADAIRDGIKALEEQKPAEWSEEDETCLEYALWCVTKTRCCVAKDVCDLDACQCAERWLKSLRPQPHWKPSEEQIDALEHFIRSWGESGTMSPQNTILCAAKSLLNDLKKL